MQDCLQGNVVIHTAGVSLLCKQHLQHFDRLSEQSILLFYKDMRYNEPKKNQTAAKQTFGFSGSLTGNYPVMQDKEHKGRIYKIHVEQISHDRKHRDMSCQEDV